MRSSLLENLQQVCPILNKHAVEYMVVGGTAVILHGFDRLTKNSAGRETKVNDLDFWFNPTMPNYLRLLDALETLGQDMSRVRQEELPNPKRSFFRLERPQFTLDFLPEIPGLPRFREAVKAKATMKVGEVEISVIGFDHLIQSKQALNRPKDQEDIRQLQIKRAAKKPRQRPRQRPG